ncbi:MAG: hypothetical protein FWG84_07880 [Bacteroidales bacterium]|nr:hypothetical protein [Bacteroidales bacterium]
MFVVVFVFVSDSDIKNVNNRYNFARDMFMLSFCLWGTNAKDLYECTDFQNGRITYNRAKTKDRRDDGAKISIKVEPEVMPLVAKYRDKTDKYTVHQMLNHVDGKMKITERYIRKDWTVFDKTNRKLLDYVFEKKKKKEKKKQKTPPKDGA